VSQPEHAKFNYRWSKISQLSGLAAFALGGLQFLFRFEGIGVMLFLVAFFCCVLVGLIASFMHAKEMVKLFRGGRGGA
jgi:hypothetical protein